MRYSAGIDLEWAYLTTLENRCKSLFQSSSDDFSYETGTSVPGGFRENETALPHGGKKEGKERRKKEKFFPLALDKLHFIPSIYLFFCSEIHQGEKSSLQGGIFLPKFWD